MSISLITNFDINSNNPIDSRIVASNSTVRNSILYPYVGLKVYQTDNNTNYIWKSGTWSLDANGIYGGSGSLSGNTVINAGLVDNTAGTSSLSLKYGISTTTDSLYYSTFFNRHTTGSDGSGVLLKTQFVHNNNAGAYISYNPLDALSREGGLAFGTGDGASIIATERLRITRDGFIGIATSNPKGLLHIGAATQSLVIDIATGSVSMGFNWFNNTGSDDVITLSNNSSYIKYDSTGMSVYSRNAYDTNTSFVQSLLINSTQSLLYMDISAGTQSAIIPNFQLLDVPTFVNNTEHRFTKIQSDNWVDLSTTGASYSSHLILLNDKANSFDISVKPNNSDVTTTITTTANYITDIKIRRTSLYGISNYSAPDGTIINIRFRHTTNPNNLPFFIKVKTSNSDTSSNIRSTYVDTCFFTSVDGELTGSTTGINIEHNPSAAIYYPGDNITFRMSGGIWDIININRERTINTTLQSIVPYVVPIGCITEYAGVSSPPSGWLLCDGSILLTADYPNLFNEISDSYGGDGSTTFGLPDKSSTPPLTYIIKY